MTSDDDRIAYLAGDDPGSLDDFDQAELDELKAMLADPTLWEDPGAGLEDSIMAAIGADVGSATRPTPAPPPPPQPQTHTPAAGRRRWLRPVAAVGGLPAAAAVVIGVVVVGGDEAESPTNFEVALPAPGGSVHVERKAGGWEFVLDLPGLPRREGGDFYQAWLRNAEGVLVPVGSFNEGEDVVLWAGVSPLDFPTFSITRETADGDQASSGDRVLAVELVPPD